MAVVPLPVLSSTAAATATAAACVTIAAMRRLPLVGTLPTIPAVLTAVPFAAAARPTVISVAMSLRPRRAQFPMESLALDAFPSISMVVRVRPV